MSLCVRSRLTASAQVSGSEPRPWMKTTGILPGWYGSIKSSFGLNVSFARIEKAFDKSSRRLGLEIDQRGGKIAIERPCERACRDNAKYQGVVEFQHGAAVRGPQHGGHGKRLPLAEVRLFAAGLPDTYQRHTQPRVVIMMFKVAVKIGCRQDLREIARSPCEAVIGYRDELDALSGFHRQVSAGIEAAAAVGPQEQAGKTFPVVPQGSAIAAFELPPGRYGRAIFRFRVALVFPREGLGGGVRDDRRARTRGRICGKARGRITESLPTRQTTCVAPSENDRSDYDNVRQRRGAADCESFDRRSLSGPVHDPTSPRRQIIKQV